MNVILASLMMTMTSPEALVWMDDYGQALRAARAAQRPLLIVLDDGSTSEQTLRHISYRRDATPEELLQAYVLCRIDVSTPYGKKVADAFHATRFPLALISDKTVSTILAREHGSLTKSQWTSMLIMHQGGGRPVFSYPTFEATPARCFT